MTPNCKLGEICDVSSSKRIFAADYVKEGVPFYRSKEIIEKALGEYTSSELFIERNKFDAIKKQYGAPVDGDLLISSVGARSGIPYRVQSDGDFYFKDGNLLWMRNFSERVDSRFIYYYLKSELGQKRLQNIMIGAAQPALTIIGMKGLEVPCPDYETQVSVGSFLEYFDYLISINRNKISRLERTSNLLYRDWIVNFKFPGHEKVEMVDSRHPDFGMIPEGWAIGPLESICELYRENINPDRLPEKVFNHYSLPSFDQGRRPVREQGSEIKSGKYLLKSNTVLFPKLNPRIPRIWRLEDVSDNSICSSEFLPLNSSDKLEYIFALFSDPKFIDNCITEASGTSNSHQRLKPDVFMKKDILVPDPKVLGEFNKLVRPMNQLRDRLNESNYVLATIRDLLLPKLISGEIDISRLDLERDQLSPFKIENGDLKNERTRS